MTAKAMAVMLTLLALAASPSWGATVSGSIVDHSGQPVPGMTVIVRDVNGRLVRSATSDSRGVYSVESLPEGTYGFALDHGASIFKKGGPVEFSVTDSGLTLDWTVSESDPAVAVAGTGAAGTVVAGGPFGLTTFQWVAISVAGIAAAGGVGAAALGGGGGGSGGGSSVASPSK